MFTGPDHISRHTGVSLKDTLTSLLSYLVSLLRDCPGVNKTGQATTIVWDDISELWFISIQGNKLGVKYNIMVYVIVFTYAELSHTAGWKSDLVQAATDSDSVQQLTAVVTQIGEHSKGTP